MSGSIRGSSLRGDADVIVVGAGPAGIAAARAAGRVCRKVILLEAGSPYSERLASPDMFTTHTIPEVWWPGVTAVRAASHTANQTETPYLQGRVFGGGSAVNGMVCVPGDTRAYEWQPDLVPIVQRLLANTVPANLGSFATDVIRRVGSALGFADTLHTEQLDRTGWARAALWANDESFKRRRPALDSDGDLTGNSAGNSAGNLNEDLAESWNKNTVEVVTNAEVESIDFGGRKPRVVWANGEASARHIVLACGAIHTPRLLHRSGYSHTALGQWASDHPALCFRFPPATDPRPTASPGAAISQATAIGRWKSSPAHEVVDLQLMPVERMPDGNAALFLALTDSRSRGLVDFTSTFPNVDLRLLDHDDDLMRLRTATRKLLSTLTTSLDSEVLSGTDSDTNEWMRANVGGYFHICGTARCADPGSGIVNAFGRMYDHQDVSICDLSITPNPPTGNPMLLAFALGQLVGETVGRVVAAY